MEKQFEPREYYIDKESNLGQEEEESKEEVKNGEVKEAGFIGDTHAAETFAKPIGITEVQEVTNHRPQEPVFDIDRIPKKVKRGPGRPRIRPEVEKKSVPKGGRPRLPNHLKARPLKKLMKETAPLMRACDKTKLIARPTE